MAYLLDTCVISEMVAARPDPNVLAWLDGQDESLLYLSVITWGELLKGIYPIPPGRKRTLLETWLSDELLPMFDGHILDIDQKLIATWAKASAYYRNKGIVRPLLDSLIEAAAIEHQLIFVTRNERNFKDSIVSILNPWSHDAG